MKREYKPLYLGAFLSATARLACQEPSEIEAVKDRVYQLGYERCIVEIGSDGGGSLCHWAELAPEILISVDIREHVHRRNVIPRLRLTLPNVYEFIGPSASEAVQISVRWTLNEAHKVAPTFFFIDGDHRSPFVAEDFDWAMSWVRQSGGVIGLHDIRTEGSGVPEFWRSLPEHYVTEEYCTREVESNMGIGLVIVPPGGYG